MTISPSTARQLVLYAQGLHDGSPLPSTLATIQRLGYVQIDSISVIERAHHHTLWVRQPNYQAKDLEALQRGNRAIFEYWSHAAAYLPIEDYRYCLPRMEKYASGKNHWFEQNQEVMKYVLDRIKAEGPLRSKDFKKPEGHQSGAWWNWKPTKIALEQLFHAGKLMILRRDKFQKVYDLTENVLPTTTDQTFPTEKEKIAYLIDRTIQAQGLATVDCMRYLRKYTKKAIRAVLEEGLKEGRYVEVKIEKLPDVQWYTTKELLDKIPNLPSKAIHILCPFDNLIIQRKRMRQLFNFNYRLECYVPAAKRLIGYYTLPILFQDRFVSQIDLKADRKTKQLLIKNQIFEEGESKDAEWWNDFENKLKTLMRFNNCEELVR